MNIRKNIDYSEMYEILDMLMALQLSQMELYCEIGKAVSQRTEKGAAVLMFFWMINRVRINTSQAIVTTIYFKNS